jgi:hypothetical protein
MLTTWYKIFWGDNNNYIVFCWRLLSINIEMVSFGLVCSSSVSQWWKKKQVLPRESIICFCFVEPHYYYYYYWFPNNSKEISFSIKFLYTLCIFRSVKYC